MKEALTLATVATQAMCFVVFLMAVKPDAPILWQTVTG